LNLSALRNHVRSLVAINSTDLLSDADLTIFINESYMDILRDADWPFLRNQTTLVMVPGTASYNLPAGVGETQIASIAALSDDTNRRQLKPRNRYATDDSPGPLVTGYPTEYSVWRGQIQVFPTPDASETLTIRYLEDPVELATNTDTPIFDSKFHTVVAYGAAVRVLFREGDDTERRQFYFQQFNRGLEQMKGDYLSERDRSLFRLGGRRRVFGRRDNYYGV
jgi:hypothetical protein